MKAAAIDGLVSDQVLRALEPAALELSLAAIADIERDRERLHHHWRQRLERARYEVERAERQYQAVEPENRLVARTLEGRWEEAMRGRQQLEEDYDRFLRGQPACLSEEERARIRVLSCDIPALWEAPETTAADRKEIIRLVVERVVVWVRSDSEEVEATIHWRGGSTSHHTIVRPVRRYEHLHDFDQLVDHLTRWRREGYSAGQMAEKLRAAGFRPPRGHGEYTEGTGATTAAPLRPDRRSSEGRRSRPERVVALRSGRRLGPPRVQAARLGGARLGPRAEDAGAAPMDRLGRQVRAEATTPAQGPLETWNRGLPRRSDHAGATGMSSDGAGDRNRIVSGSTQG